MYVFDQVDQDVTTYFQIMIGRIMQKFNSRHDNHSYIFEIWIKFVADKH